MEETARALLRRRLCTEAIAGLVIVSLVALVVIVVPPPASAAAPQTLVIRPNGVGDYSTWSKKGCSQNWKCVAEATADGDASYVVTDLGGIFDSYQLEDISLPGIVNSVTLKAVGRVSSGTCTGSLSNACISLGIGGLGTNYFDNALPFGTTYTTVSFTWTTNPITRKNWTVAEVNAAQAEVLKVDDTSTVRVTQVWWEINITVSPGPIILHPNGKGAFTQWSRSKACNPNWACVDDLSPDGDATYVFSSTGAISDSYKMEDLTIAGTISSVTLYAVGRVASGACSAGLYNWCIELGITNGQSELFCGSFTLPTTYGTVGCTWNTYPYSGLPWTVADVNGLQVVLWKSDSSSTIRVTQVYIAVTIAPA